MRRAMATSSRTGSFQYPGTNYYTEVGKELLNQHNAEKAKQLLKEAGYNGEKVVLLTNKDYPSLYNSALVMSQQLKAIGINAELLVLDWPTALQKSMKGTPDWNFFFTGWITYVAVGGVQTLRPMAEPNPVYTPPDGKTDPEFMKAFEMSRTGRHWKRGRRPSRGRRRSPCEDVMVDPDGRDAEGAGGARQRRALRAILQSTHVQRLVEELMLRIVVIGAGVMGASVAYRLAQAGASVTVLEAGRVGGGTSGCSFAWTNSIAKTPRSLS